ncbi:Scn11a, partial [Symbiodinium natans]
MLPATASIELAGPVGNNAQSRTTISDVSEVRTKCWTRFVQAAEEAPSPTEQSEDERRKPRVSKFSHATAHTTDTNGVKRKRSFRPIFHTFTQADLALKQRAADVDSKRTRRLFQARSSSEGILEERQNCLGRLTSHPVFDTFFAFLVVSNTIFIGIEVQETLSHPGERPTVFYVVQYVYTGLFTLELLLRVAAEGLRFFCAEDWAWGWLDLIVVVSSLTEVAFDILESQGVTNMTGLRAFRVIRITRFLKTLRLVRVFRFVMALRTLITSIMYTLRSLFWALVLLALIIYVFSVLLAQAVSEHRLSGTSSLPVETTDAATKYFSTLPRTMLTLFMAISGGVSWEEVAAPLEAISMVWLFVFLFYVAFTYFAVLNVLTGVFCQSAIESAQNDHANVVQSMLANKEAHVEKIRALFSKLGAERDGIITYSMFEQGISSQAVVEYFETL